MLRQSIVKPPATVYRSSAGAAVVIREREDLQRVRACRYSIVAVISEIMLRYINLIGGYCRINGKREDLLGDGRQLLLVRNHATTPVSAKAN